jgi:hypothetical protein
LRRQEEQAAARRRAELDAAEHKRRAFVRDGLTQRRNEESRLLFVAISGMVIFLVALVIYLVITVLL